MKLNQVIAISKGEKAKMESTKTKFHHLLKKAELLKGISKRYQPFVEDPTIGEESTLETKNVQLTVEKAMQEVISAMKEGFNIIATQDLGNCIAKADIKIDDKVVVAGVPVTHLIYLEKQMIDLNTFVSGLPELDPGEEWSYDAVAGAWKTHEKTTYKSKKIFKNHVRAEATKEHPAQVDTYTEDIPVGKYVKIEFSGNLHKQTKEELLDKISKLTKAIKLAREEANSIEVTRVSFGDSLLTYIFGF
jgi:hypothetical protein